MVNCAGLNEWVVGNKKLYPHIWPCNNMPMHKKLLKWRKRIVKVLEGRYLFACFVLCSYGAWNPKTIKEEKPYQY
jgi:hypothetical protein